MFSLYTDPTGKTVTDEFMRPASLMRVTLCSSARTTVPSKLEIQKVVIKIREWPGFLLP